MLQQVGILSHPVYASICSVACCIHSRHESRCCRSGCTKEHAVPSTNCPAQYLREGLCYAHAWLGARVYPHATVL
jgi:hypothetical protein